MKYRSRNVPTIQRSIRLSVVDLGSRPEGRAALDTWLRGICIAPDAATPLRNAAAIELRYLDLYERFS